MRSLALAVGAFLLACLAALACAGRRKSGFAPRPGDVCAGRPDWTEASASTDPRGAAGTVDVLPFSEPSEVSLARGAASPEVAEARFGPNPYTGLGKTARVRAWGDPYLGAEACRRRSIFELQPGEPGFLEPLALEPSPALRSGHCSAPLVSPVVEFQTDGPFGDALAALAT